MAVKQLRKFDLMGIFPYRIFITIQQNENQNIQHKVMLLHVLSGRYPWKRKNENENESKLQPSILPVMITSDRVIVCNYPVWQSLSQPSI